MLFIVIYFFIVIIDSTIMAIVPIEVNLRKLCFAERAADTDNLNHGYNN